MKAVKPRPEMRGLPVYEPGKPAPRGAIKLASNENAFGAPPRVRAALAQFKDVGRYPDASAAGLRADLAARLKCRPDELIVGAGSDEIGDMIAHAYFRAGDRIVFPRYTFIRYAMSAHAAGARAVETPVDAWFRPDVDALIRESKRARAVFIAHPNNPTGVCIGRAELARLARDVPASTLLVIDEAYYEYARLERGYASAMELRRPNLIVLRTFSKIYGLASLRVGYARADRDVINELHKVRPPFNVSTPAQLAARAALTENKFVERCARINRAERESLLASFRSWSVPVIPSAGNFLMFRVSSSKPVAGSIGREFCGRMARRGLILRDLNPYGLPDWARVTIGLPAENRRLVRALRAELAG